MLDSNDMRATGVSPAPPSTLWRKILGRSLSRAARQTDATPPPADMRKVRLRLLYDDIGRFLFANDLDLTPLNFGCAHDYLSGDDLRLTRAIEDAMRDRRVSNNWIERLVYERPDAAISPDMLVETADTVEQELDRCVKLLKRSCTRACDYRDALTAATERQDSETIMEYLVEITRGMIEQTRQAEADMRRSQKQASDLRATLRAARKASEIDHLTNLPNRRGFERILAEMLAGVSARPTRIAIALCDIDHFKLINDRFGHDTGDRVLQLLGHEFRQHLDRPVQVARLGGEEFVILFPDNGLDQAGVILDRLRERLAARNLVDRTTRNSVGQVTFSAGLTMIDDPVDPKAAIKLADLALYAAKHAGRNCIYTSSGAGKLAPFG